VCRTARLDSRNWLPSDIKRGTERRKVGQIIRKKKGNEQREMRETFLSKIIFVRMLPGYARSTFF